MLRHPVRLAATAALVLALAACGRKSPVEQATPDVQALLAAVRAADAAAFEARLDRPALRANLRQQLASVGRANALDVDGGPSEAALDRRIDPAALSLAAQGSGQPLAEPPSAAQTTALLKGVDQDHVCVHDQTPAKACVLTFAREKSGWRLVAMPAQPGAVIVVGPEPPKK